MNCRGGWRALTFLAVCLITVAALLWLFLSPPSIVVRWQTETEVDTVAFNLLRAADESEAFVAVNAQPIPAQGSATTGADYAHTDRTVQRGVFYTYRLQEITAQGDQITYPLQASARSQRSWPQVVGALLFLSVLWGVWLLACGGRRGRQPEQRQAAADAS